MPQRRRRICFVTGSRAEFGLMQSTLRAIQKHPKLQLQIIATGMHLNPVHGEPLAAIHKAGFKADGVVNWGREPDTNIFRTSISTGMACAAITIYFQKL